MKLIEDKQNILAKLKNKSFIPYNLIGILENTENQAYIDEDTDSVWVEHQG